jgi:hypothetical protein
MMLSPAMFRVMTPSSHSANRLRSPVQGASGQTEVSGSLAGLELKFTNEDSERANASWKATCGPHSIAAACRMSLEEVRPALVDYKGWMSPTQVESALATLGWRFSLRKGLKAAELCEGINRIQWEGPWLNPGVPPRVAYFHTHWVAHFRGWVLCTACEPAKWISAEEWREFHLTVEPTSPFHITHHYSLEPGQGIA